MQPNNWTKIEVITKPFNLDFSTISQRSFHSINQKTITKHAHIKIQIPIQNSYTIRPMDHPKTTPTSHHHHKPYNTSPAHVTTIHNNIVARVNHPDVQ